MPVRHTNIFYNLWCLFNWTYIVWLVLTTKATFVRLQLEVLWDVHYHREDYKGMTRCMAGSSGSAPYKGNSKIRRHTTWLFDGTMRLDAAVFNDVIPLDDLLVTIIKHTGKSLGHIDEDKLNLSCFTRVFCGQLFRYTWVFSFWW